jgi:mRNA-degrading endonuclease HigB of HigAB toxin-antitoxin module
MGGTKTADVPKELDVQESLNLTDRIGKFLIDGCKTKKKKKLIESTMVKTILKQINSIDRFALASWGAKNFVAGEVGIRFDVRGSKFRGQVMISYDRGSDTYVIELGQVRKLEWKQKYLIKNVFAQDLVNVLDQQVG